MLDGILLTGDLPMRCRTASRTIFVLGLMAAHTVGQAQTAPASVPAPAAATPPAAAAPVEPAWVVRSNQYTRELLDVQMKHSPEQGSAQGEAKYDTQITDASRADEIAQRKELEDVLARLKNAEATEKDKNVREDLEIVQKAFNLQFRRDDYVLDHKVQFLDASQLVFIGLRVLLDDQMAAARRPAALVRLRKYAGVEPGFTPFTDVLKQRAMEQMAKPGVIYPSISEIETVMGQDKSYVDGIAGLFRKYKLTGWEDAFAKLSEELGDYDTWVRGTLLPKARKDFKMQPAEYALALENYGVELPPEELATEAHAAFTAIQAEMAPLAVQVAKEHGWKSTDYRDVMRELKKEQVTGDAILPLYQKRLKSIEEIIAAKNLVTLPDRPAIIRLATAAETAQQPAPHMVPPPLLHNTGQRGEFVLPLNIPSSTGGEADQYDDFTFDAAAWPLTAHEVRPGHELQFDSMVEHGVSLARALYAFNSTNAEGWGLYSEWMMQPYEPIDGQLVTLDYRLLRAARAFLDPELQSGKIDSAEAYKVLEFDVVLSPAFAKEEVERYTFLAQGQANSYFYGYTKLMELRKDTEAALGKKFDQKRYHDFLLAQGLLPPDLLRRAVMEEFVPREKKR
jgi:uncharacterized protein (DUF885 family)